MKERPIYPYPWELRAILDGRKSQFRRVVKPQHMKFFDQSATDMLAQWGQRPAPYGLPGDRLWVREAWRTSGDGGRVNDTPPRELQPHEVWYEADGKAPDDECVGKLRHGMFMPRWASRITLEVTGVRVERLQDISPDDCIAEGCWPAEQRELGRGHEAVAAYRALWEQINGHLGWDANPWVWVIEFKAVTP